MLVVHHLGISQSERITWLLEELSIPYQIVKHVRAPLLSPDSLKAVAGNATGKSPFIEDTDAGITLSESGAIVEYIISKYGGGRLALGPSHPNYADYLHWFHFANGTLQMNMVVSMFVDAGADNPRQKTADERLHTGFRVLDDRLRESRWLAGLDFTAADIMNLYCLTTQRYFGPLVDFTPYPNIVRYLRDCAERPAYQRAMEKGDPDMRLLLAAEPAEGGYGEYWRHEVGSLEEVVVGMVLVDIDRE